MISQRIVNLLICYFNLMLQTFSKVSSLVNKSREKIRVVKENLHECKKLLSCRRDELKKLWLEGIEHKHTLQLLDEMYVKKNCILYFRYR